MKFLILLKRFIKSPIFIFSIIYFIIIGVLSQYSKDTVIKAGILDNVKSEITTTFVNDLKSKKGFFQYNEYSTKDALNIALKSGKIKTAFTIDYENGMVFYENNVVQSPISGVIREIFYSSYFKIYALNVGKDLVKDYTDTKAYEESFYKYLNGNSVYSFNFLGNTLKVDLFPLESLVMLGLLITGLLYIYDLLKIRDTSSIGIKVSIFYRYIPIISVYIVALILLVLLKKFELNIIIDFIVLFLGTFILYIFCEKYTDKSSYLLFATMYILGFITTSGLIINSRGAIYINIASIIYLLISSFQRRKYE